MIEFFEATVVLQVMVMKDHTVSYHGRVSNDKSHFHKKTVRREARQYCKYLSR